MIYFFNFFLNSLLIQKGETVPKIKPEFLQLIHRQQPLVQPFSKLINSEKRLIKLFFLFEGIFESAEAHQLTDYWKWFYANSPYQVHAFSDKYEPYIIAEYEMGYFRI